MVVCKPIVMPDTMVCDFHDLCPQDPGLSIQSFTKSKLFYYKKIDKSGKWFHVSDMTDFYYLFN